MYDADKTITQDVERLYYYGLVSEALPLHCTRGQSLLFTVSRSRNILVLHPLEFQSILYAVVIA